MNNSTKKEELTKQEKEHFILKLLYKKGVLTHKEIKIDFDKKNIIHKGNLISKSILYTYIINLVGLKFVKKIGKSPFKLEFSDAVKEIIDLIDGGPISYDELLSMDFYIKNSRQVIDTLIRIKIFEIFRLNRKKMIRHRNQNFN